MHIFFFLILNTSLICWPNDFDKISIKFTKYISMLKFDHPIVTQLTPSDLDLINLESTLPVDFEIYSIDTYDFTST